MVFSYSLTAQIKIGNTLPVITLNDSSNHEVIFSTTPQKFTLFVFWGAAAAAGGSAGVFFGGVITE